MVIDAPLQILVVGSVRNVTSSATKVSYEVGDGTGYIDVNQWLDSSDDESGKMDGIEWVQGAVLVWGRWGPHS